MAERKYCQSKDNVCPDCGRMGWEIKFCRRPFSDARMREIMEGLGHWRRTNKEPVSVRHPDITVRNDREREQNDG